MQQWKSSIFYVVHAATAAMQWFGKHTSRTEMLFSVQSVPRGYKKDKKDHLRQLSGEILWRWQSND
jgi:hypothetical protein